MANDVDVHILSCGQIKENSMNFDVDKLLKSSQILVWIICFLNIVNRGKQKNNGGLKCRQIIKIFTVLTVNKSLGSSQIQSWIS